MWWHDVLLFFCFPASAPVWVWFWLWGLMWKEGHWCFVLYWSWYYLSFCLWAFRLKPSVVFRLRSAPVFGKKPPKTSLQPP